MILKDIFHTPYFNEDGSVNKDCILFVWVSEENKNKYLQEHLCSNNK